MKVARGSTVRTVAHRRSRSRGLARKLALDAGQRVPTERRRRPTGNARATPRGRPCTGDGPPQRGRGRSSRWIPAWRRSRCRPRSGGRRSRPRRRTPPCPVLPPAPPPMLKTPARPASSPTTRTGRSGERGHQRGRHRVPGRRPLGRPRTRLHVGVPMGKARSRPTTTGDIPFGMGWRAEHLDDGLRRDLDRRFVSFFLFVVAVFVVVVVVPLVVGRLRSVSQTAVPRGTEQAGASGRPVGLRRTARPLRGHARSRRSRRPLAGSRPAALTADRKAVR